MPHRLRSATRFHSLLFAALASTSADEAAPMPDMPGMDMHGHATDPPQLR